MRRPFKWTALAAVIVVAAVLRFGDLGLMEFKGDEAVAIHLALPLAEGKALPQVGLVSSVGVHNPPLFIYLTALPALIDVDPLFVTGALVGLTSLLSVFATFFLLRRRFGETTAFIATAFYGCATWPVLYGRKLWAQDCLPLFSIVTLWLLFVTWERPKTRWIAAGPVVLCALFQLHFSAFAVILVAAALVLWRWRTINWVWLAGGIVAAGITLWPYIQYQRAHEWSDIQGMRQMAAGKRADGSAREKPKSWSLDPAAWTGYVSAGTALDYSVGAEAAATITSRPLRWAGFAGKALLFTGLFALAWVGFSRRDGASVIALAWIVGYVGIYLLLMGLILGFS